MCDQGDISLFARDEVGGDELELAFDADFFLETAFEIVDERVKEKV